MSQHIENGLTVNEVRTEIVKALRTNHITQCNFEELFSIFFDPSDVWARREHLIDRITTSRDPIRLEEAGRIIINPMLYYVSGDAKYYVYGG